MDRRTAGLGGGAMEVGQVGDEGDIGAVSAGVCAGVCVGVVVLLDEVGDEGSVQGVGHGSRGLVECR